MRSTPEYSATGALVHAPRLSSFHQTRLNSRHFTVITLARLESGTLHRRHHPSAYNPSPFANFNAFVKPLCLAFQDRYRPASEMRTIFIGRSECQQKGATVSVQHINPPRVAKKCVSRVQQVLRQVRKQGVPHTRYWKTTNCCVVFGLIISPFLPIG